MTTKSGLEFFTSDLFIAVNSDDPVVADAAADAWTVALKEYKEYRDRVLVNAPPSVRRLAEACFHDAVVTVSGADHRYPTLYLLTEGNKKVRIRYTTWGSVHRQKIKHPVFAKSPTVWLYDEVISVWKAKSLYAHRILFGDGLELFIPFRDVTIEVEEKLAKLRAAE